AWSGWVESENARAKLICALPNNAAAAAQTISKIASAASIESSRVRVRCDAGLLAAAFNALHQRTHFAMPRDESSARLSRATVPRADRHGEWDPAHSRRRDGRALPESPDIFPKTRSTTMDRYPSNRRARPRDASR